ncbi:LacI family DNA-binding transcriptional regulator [Alkalicoccobacillus porphyridii]|uniref:LacI family transcriptional regulator n=1 Tax=Alkalicoccobacillus porphyridii TaxID=2597270 RepID=A0A554A2A9_9BACI|nr:substrate-binding domain-containing protein [Alkalicoccobacillus porphyridii]TSB47823.1 LacI family transcriptional regulator [Alkalicoccobacillus porphyridii]
MKKITMANVAEHAGVSKSTVSQYLNERFHYMSEDTKIRIELAIKELGYSPNSIARSLRQKRTSTIGVIVSNILHDFSTQVVRAIEDICNENSFHVIICNADDDPDKEKRYIEMLQAKQVDGLIVFPTSDNTELFQELIAAHYPLVFVDRVIEGVAVDVILTDNESALRLAVDSLVERGYKEISLITAPLIEHITPRGERKDGFYKAMNEQQITIREDLVHSVQLEEVQSVLSQMLADEVPPTALIAGNDRILQEILKQVQARGISIPNELAVLGIDDVRFAEFFNPPLTTVAQPTYEIGKKAAEILLHKIKEAHTNLDHQIYRLHPELKLRASI